MKRLILGAISALALAPCAARAALLPRLDIDELLFRSDAVVLASVVRTRTEKYQTLADVKAERTFSGEGLTGKTLRLDVSLYSVERSSGHTSREFQTGDRALFFLRNTARHPETWGQKAQGYDILLSGVRLLRPGRVADFAQISNPGGFSEQNGVSRAVFDAGFAASRARISDLKARLRAPVRLEDKTYFEHWKAARRQTRLRFAMPGDSISQTIDERLRRIALLKRRAARTR